ncbi:hypothetical protein A1O1_00435 [Capronia coronata CBS 617.96]|uniref:HIT-type domain-containing protein n=1 Tax=Capronia coronata CBS 617.96 TaxID=1182541 RepID=W9Z039_9EURO|nr:uncharacterized protein A1O1_00435 [Capronia coronata CBS 617.96]EXJ95315.1 hypothetical protein A1O1_00435 [Capronia coronata CBS 617.96]
MPLIEELPVTSTHNRPSHGWTYVPDTGAPNPIPSAPLLLGSRKRGRDGTTTHASTAQSQAAAHKLSAKQEKAIQQRLNDLGKENYRDVHIPVPKRDGVAAGKGREREKEKDRKPSQNVRRILAYSRTFQHYLADEEAGVNVYGSAGIVSGVVGGVSNTGAASGGHAQGQQQQKPADSKRVRGGAMVDKEQEKMTTAAGRRNGSLKQKQTVSTPTMTTTSTNTTTRTTKTRKGGAIESDTSVKTESRAVMGDTDVDMADAPDIPLVSVSAETGTSAQQTQIQQSPLPSTSTDPNQLSQSQSQSNQIPEDSVVSYDPALDRDPLLRTRDLPKMPSERVMQALLAEPPLSYTAARAKPLGGAVDGMSVSTRAGGVSGGGGSSSLLRPQRWFCTICGYWGKVRCKNGCGERVCGLLECWRGHEGVCSLGAY